MEKRVELTKEDSIERQGKELLELLVLNKLNSKFSGKITIVINNGKIEGIQNFTYWGSSAFGSDIKSGLD